jgi:hypothetical protein
LVDRFRLNVRGYRAPILDPSPSYNPGLASQEQMFFRAIREKIDNLRRMVQKVEQTQGAVPVDIADLKRLLLARIAELESKEATEGSQAPTSQTRRAA